MYLISSFTNRLAFSILVSLLSNWFSVESRCCTTVERNLQHCLCFQKRNKLESPLNTFTVPVSSLYFLTHAAEHLLYLILSEEFRSTCWFHTLEMTHNSNIWKTNEYKLYLHLCMPWMIPSSARSIYRRVC